MMNEKQKKIQHLFLRAGFGQPYRVVQRGLDISIDELVEKIFLASAKIKPIDVVKVKERNRSTVVIVQKGRTLREERIANKQNLNIAWFNELAYSNAFLREKMALFWHDHFASKHKGAYFMQNQINIIREHALGNFGTLLKAVSKDPVMIAYLHSYKNVKGMPNENFGRELLELFTLGGGNYTEQDIKEASRAFTGWSYKRNGEFIVRKKDHDDGRKVFLGREGHWTGDDILTILLETKQTAYFICTKIYAYFVNESLDQDIIKNLAEDFYKSNYDIGRLMYTIFTSDWFYKEKNRNNKIKSPIEYLAGLSQTLELKYTDNSYILFIQNALGQRLFNPPNVSGWESGNTWIDSALLMLRIKFPKVIFSDKEISFNPKSIGDANDFVPTNVNHKGTKAEMDWNKLEAVFKTSGDSIDVKALSLFLLQSEQFAELLKEGKETGIKSCVLKALQIPEFQLC